MQDFFYICLPESPVFNSLPHWLILSLPPPFSSNSWWALFVTIRRVLFWMPLGKASLFAFKKIPEHPGGRCCVLCVCLWNAVVELTTFPQSPRFPCRGIRKASNPTLVNLPPPHTHSIPIFMPLNAVYYFFQGWWVNSKWYKICKGSLVESLTSSWALSKWSISCIHLSKSRVGGVKPNKRRSIKEQHSDTD